MGTHQVSERDDPTGFHVERSRLLAERFAVLGGPGGATVVTMPTTRMAAHALRARHEEFWCGTLAGGCGDRLTIKAGQQRVPHFSHLPGDGRVDCSRSGQPRLMAERYTHLLLQQDLRDWLRALGHEPSIEHRFVAGRFDLHVRVGDQAHAIEIQRSPLSKPAWQERDTRYAAEVDCITWLWGRERETEALLALHTRGVAYYIDHDQELRTQVTTLVFDSALGPKKLHSFLADCSLDNRGLWTPHRDLADNAHRALLEAERQREAEKEAKKREAERRLQWEKERRLVSRRQSEARAQGGRSGVGQPPVAHQASLSGLSPNSLARRKLLHPDISKWSRGTDLRWIEGLPEHLRESAVYLAHYVAELYDAGPVSGLEWDDVPDPDRLQAQALLDVGLIELDASGRRWQRLR